MPLMVDTFFYENKKKHNFYQNMTSGKLREDNLEKEKENLEKLSMAFASLKGKLRKLRKI